MKPADELRRATASAEAGPDFRAERLPGLARITPLNERASSWLHVAVSPESRWTGETLVVEMLYFAKLADAAIDAGFLFGRDTYLN